MIGFIKRFFSSEEFFTRSVRGLVLGVAALALTPEGSALLGGINPLIPVGLAVLGGAIHAGDRNKP